MNPALGTAHPTRIAPAAILGSDCGPCFSGDHLGLRRPLAEADERPGTHSSSLTHEGVSEVPTASLMRWRIHSRCSRFARATLDDGMSRATHNNASRIAPKRPRRRRRKNPRSRAAARPGAVCARPTLTGPIQTPVSRRLSTLRTNKQPQVHARIIESPIWIQRCVT